MNVACPALVQLAGPKPAIRLNASLVTEQKKGQDQVTYSGGVPATVSAFVQRPPFYVWDVHALV